MLIFFFVFLWRTTKINNGDDNQLKRHKNKMFSFQNKLYSSVWIERNKSFGFDRWKASTQIDWKPKIYFINECFCANLHKFDKFRLLKIVQFGYSFIVRRAHQFKFKQLTAKSSEELSMVFFFQNWHVLIEGIEYRPLIWG